MPAKVVGTSTTTQITAQVPSGVTSQRGGHSEWVPEPAYPFTVDPPFGVTRRLSVYVRLWILRWRVRAATPLLSMVRLLLVLIVAGFPFAPPATRSKNQHSFPSARPGSNLSGTLRNVLQLRGTRPGPFGGDEKAGIDRTDYRKHLRIASGLTELDTLRCLSLRHDLSRPTRRYSRKSWIY